MSDTPQPEHIRLWALENAVERNRYASTERVLTEARRFEQYISGRPDAEIVSITAKECGK